MSTITFTASIQDGVIEIPEEHKKELGNGDSVKVTVVKKKTPMTGIIEELINNPIKVKDFTPLTRDEAHERK